MIRTIETPVGRVCVVNTHANLQREQIVTKIVRKARP